MIKESAYSVKNISIDAVIACVMGGISICAMIGSVIVSYLYDGKGPAIIGLLGVGSLLLALVGIAFTVSAWKSVDGGLTMKRIAGVVNAVPILLTIVLYILGWI